MLKLFSVNTDIDTEFSVVGVANIEEGTVEFQGHLNGETFVSGEDYEEVREEVMQRVEGNNVHSIHGVGSGLIN